MVVAAVAAVLGLLAYSGHIELDAWRPIVLAAVGVALTAIWLFVVTEDFVHWEADRYADALLAAADQD